jgi:hypothetical protein
MSVLPTVLSPAPSESILTPSDDDHHPTQKQLSLIPPPVLQLLTTKNVPTIPSSLEQDENTVRKVADHNSFYLLLLNSYAAVFVFVSHLISWATIFSSALCVGLTIYTYYVTQDNYSFDGNTMSWVLFTFAVITPIGSTIAMAFTRRENALQNISALRSTFLQLYTSYSIWGWDYTPGNVTENGRTKVRCRKNRCRVLQRANFVRRCN